MDEGGGVGFDSPISVGGMNDDIEEPLENAVTENAVIGTVKSELRDGSLEGGGVGVVGQGVGVGWLLLVLGSVGYRYG